MSNICSIKSRAFFYVILLTSASFYIQASTSVTVNQSSNTVSWQISGNSYVIDEVKLTVTGSNESSANINGCTSNPLNCVFNFNGSGATFETSLLSSGTYNWQIEIIPLIGELDCASPSDVREAQGGFQGLTSGAPLFEQDYIKCLRDSGLLPSDDSELNATGSFNIESNGLLIVPIDQTQGNSDNSPPIALCKDVVVEGSGSGCLVSADVNDGSTDTDGTLVSLVQTPPGPYGLGETVVTLTVTDNLDATSSCSANVTVTDSLAPVVDCPTDNTMTPPTAPKSFTATASDTCSIPTIQVTSYDCYRINPHGNHIDTNDSCVVTVANDSITVNETSGVNSYVDWTVEATDSEGNTTESICTVNVLHPNS